jgi:hypothetical protein
MTKLEKKIRNAYGNAEELITLVRKVGLEKILSNTLTQIEATIKTKDYDKLASLSGTILTGVNSKLSMVSNQAEKQKIEYLLADIFEKYLITIGDQPNGSETLQQVDENLKSTCKIAGYNYSTLSSLFNVKKHLVLLPQSRINKGLYYEWVSREKKELKELVRDIADRKWIYSAKEFIRLFSIVEGNLQIRCYPDKKGELLIFFQVLKDNGLIKPKGSGSSGHFAPIVQYARDNEKNILFQKAVNKEHNKLKANTTAHEELTRKIEGMIAQVAEKSWGQRIDNRRYPKRRITKDV